MLVQQLRQYSGLDDIIAPSMIQVTEFYQVAVFPFSRVDGVVIGIGTAHFLMANGNVPLRGAIVNRTYGIHKYLPI